MNDILFDSAKLKRLADDTREKAREVRSKKKRDELMLKAQEIEACLSLQKWANSPGLRSPN